MIKTQVKTYREANLFMRNAQAWLADHKDPSKMAHAVTRVIKRLEGPLRTHQDRVDDAIIEHAKCDEKGTLLQEDGSYRYDKEGARKRLAKLRELSEETFEFEPYYCTDRPDLNHLERLVFAGFVLPEDDDETLGVETNGVTSDPQRAVEEALETSV